MVVVAAAVGGAAAAPSELLGRAGCAEAEGAGAGSSGKGAQTLRVCVGDITRHKTWSGSAYVRVVVLYRGTSLVRKRLPLGLKACAYDLMVVLGGWRFLMGKTPIYIRGGLCFGKNGKPEKSAQAARCGRVYIQAHRRAGQGRMTH